MIKIRSAIALGRETLAAYGEDQISRQAAALAYFTMFALAPLIIVLIEIAALALGGNGHHRQVQDQIVGAISSSTGRQSAAALRDIIAATFAQAHRQGLFAGIFSWIILLLAATGLFGAIQGSLDDIWHVERDKRPWWMMIKDRFVSFGLIAGAALALLISLAINTAIAAGSKHFLGAVPGIAVLASVLDMALSLLMVTALFAAIFKFLPHVKIDWKDVLLGALVAATLFMLGQFLLSWYLGHAGTASAFGAAGSLVVVVLWTYYSAQIFLLGAEFTKVYAHRHGSMIAASGARTDLQKR